MKNLLFLIILFSCSAPQKSGLDINKLKAEDELILSNLHEEPMRMGTKKFLKELKEC